MGSINEGNQIVSFDYKAKGRGTEFNKLHYNILPAGVYQGGLLTPKNPGSGGTEEIAIDPMVVYLYDNVTKLSIRVETFIAVDKFVTTTNPYLVCTYDWANVDENYMDITAMSWTDIDTERTAGNCVVILGKGVYDSSNDLTAVIDYTMKDIASLQSLEDRKDYFKVTTTEISPVTGAISDKVYVYPGSYVFKNLVFDFAGGDSPALSTVTGSAGQVREDLIYMTLDTGVIGVVEGNVGATYVTPSLPITTMLLAKVQREVGSTTILAENIVQFNASEYVVYPDLTDIQDIKISLHRAGDYLYDYGELDKYGVAEGDIQLVDESGIAISMADQEQEYPVSRVDNSNNSNGATYTLTTGVNEGAGHIRSFSPDVNKSESGNHSRVAFWFESVGSGYTNVKIVLHDYLNTELASQTILYANISAGAYIYADLVATLTAGQTYHYHIYMEGYTPGTAPTLVVGYIPGNFSIARYIQMYKPTGGKYGSANEDDVLVMYEDTTRSAGIRTSTDDDLAFQGDTTGDFSTGVVDIMAVDFTLEDFDTWEYNDYIGIDVNTGKIKYSGYVSGSTNAKFNTKTVFSDTRAIDILTSVGGQSIESKLNYLLGPKTEVYAKRTAIQTLTSGVVTKLQINTVDPRDILGEFNISTYTYTAKKAGKKNVTFTGSFASNSTGGRGFYVYVDGARVNNMTEIFLAPATTSSTRNSVGFAIYLAVGQTLSVYTFQDSGSPIDFEGGYFTITE